MPASDASPTRTPQRLRREMLTLLAAALAAIGLFVWLAGNERQARAELTARIDRAAALAADMAHIQSVRTAAPTEQSANVGTARVELVQQVGQAMKLAGIAAESLLSTQPQPGRPVAGTDLFEHHCRLSFSELALEPLVRFAEHLQSDSSGCRVTGLTLRAGEPPRWVAELTICVRESKK